MSGTNQDPGRSPTGLNAGTRAPRRGQYVRRVNRVPLILGLAVVAVLLLTILWTVHEKSAQRAAGGNDTNKNLASSTTPENTFIQPKAKPLVGGPTTPQGTSAPQTGQQAAVAPPGPMGPPQPPPNPYAQQWQRYEADLSRIEQAKATALESALNDDTASATRGTLASAAGGAASSGGRGTGNGIGQDDGSSDYLSNGRTAALSRFEVKAGTVIPATLITGVNSDVSGQIIGQVRQAVYDSATGDKILIPQGSKLIGTYGSHINYGQDRIQVAWERIIFPDQSSIDLPKMPGADMSGESGFEDQVNNHLWKIFGNALLTSAFGAGIQLSQPSGSSNSSYGGYSAQQIIAAQLGLQLGEVGMEFARRGLDIPPTIVIRPGYEFNVMVTKDMILPPYQDPYGNGDTHSVALNQ